MLVSIKAFALRPPPRFNRVQLSFAVASNSVDGVLAPASSFGKNESRRDRIRSALSPTQPHIAPSERSRPGLRRSWIARPRTCTLRSLERKKPSDALSVCAAGVGCARHFRRGNARHVTATNFLAAPVARHAEGRGGTKVTATDYLSARSPGVSVVATRSPVRVRNALVSDSKFADSWERVASIPRDATTFSIVPPVCASCNASWLQIGLLMWMRIMAARRCAVTEREL